ncbi:UNVERIFIED_CONTAM: hypothetical protein GTU68_012984 [Idotea baltica]|nr:hypothetical protein [Idotea baltica]
MSKDKNQNDKLQKIVSLCKRRGFVFQSSEIYGGLKSAYDYGPLGVELKRNIAAKWWTDTVAKREDVVGLDASIMMHQNVWRASGHLSGFSDPLVDCLNCKERFRADKAPKVEEGTEITFFKGGKTSGEKITGKAGAVGYVCPHCGASELSDERQFNLMFRTAIGPVDVYDGSIYLRPETAQAMFVQFLNVQQSQSLKIPFGIAQQGKSFRNEVTTEKFVFRTCEFEQMEMEWFCEPGTQKDWHKYWCEERLKWWQELSNSPEDFMLREHEPDELAHYADGCFDIEYKYPWGFDELEGVASRTDYDLKKHAEHSGSKISYFDQQKEDPETGKMGYRYTPFVIEPAAGLTREEKVDAKGNKSIRVLLKLNPKIAPVKVAVMPLVKKAGLPDLSRSIVNKFFDAGINASYDEQQSIGKRYAKNDEIGTPYCITVDHQSLEDNTVTIRDRDTTEQERISIDDALSVVKDKILKS